MESISLTNNATAVMDKGKKRTGTTDNENERAVKLPDLKFRLSFDNKKVQV
jgi:hypothetical protein